MRLLPPLPADKESGVTQDQRGCYWDNQLRVADTVFDVSSSKMLWPSKLCFIETTDIVSNYLELCSFSGPRKGSVLERTKQTKILEHTQLKEDMGGWTGRAHWQRQPRQNGAYREHFYLRQDCTEPIPGARVAAFDRTGSNPNSSPFPFSPFLLWGCSTQ